MGVPHLFKSIVEKYPKVVFFNNNVHLDNFYFDLNCLIHPCCNRILNNINLKDININNLELNMFHEICKYIEIIIDIAKPKKLIYVSIDGPAPRAKMNQQRTRRFKNVKTIKIKEEIYKELEQEFITPWDTNAITPGTRFMQKLSEHLKYFFNCKKYNAQVILSDSNVPGEGEHKIINFIKKNKADVIESHCIYGLDADLIFLALTTNIDNFYLLRERVYFKNNGNTNNLISKNLNDIDFDYMSLDILKQCMMIEYKDNLGQFFEINYIIKDFIFLCFILGNDFIPNIPSTIIKYDGIDILMNAYFNSFTNMKKYLVVNNTINHDFFLDIVKQLNNIEEATFNKIQNKRSKFRFNNEYVYDSNKTEFENKLCEKLNKHLIVYKPNNDTIELGKPGWKERYYSTYFHLAKDNKREFDLRIKDICRNYIEGVMWTFNYYFNGCKDYEWFYQYSHAPFISDIYDYLKFNNINDIKFNNNSPYKPFQQLMMVLPQASCNLLPGSYKNLINNPKSDIIQWYPNDFNVDSINKVYYWECPPDLPIIDSILMKENLDKLSLTKEEKLRNIIAKDITI